MLLTLLLVVCAVFRLSLAMNQVVNTELKESVVQELLKCINALSINYRVYVSADGHVIVIPAGRRAIDLTGMDKGLATCMLQVLGEMTVSAESSEFEDPLHQSALAAESVDFAFLLRNGAKGQRPQPGLNAGADAIVNTTTLVDRSEHRLTKRCAGYYGAFVDIYAGCNNADYIVEYYGGCPSYASSYASVFFFNPDVCNTILVGIWPHHNCAQGNEQSFYVTSSTSSPCKTRTTYSYDAVVVTR